MPELAEWDSFYVIVGSAAGGLIGLQFVVLTLIAQKPPLRGVDAGAAFATPTIVHFATVLLLAAVLRAPWHVITSIRTFWGLVGVIGVFYAAEVARRMRTQTVYHPGLEDWSFHVVLSLAAYLLLALSALEAQTHTHDALFAVGTAALLLLFIGIHNAWDAVVYHVFVSMRDSAD